MVASPDGVSSRRSRPGERSTHRTAEAPGPRSPYRTPSATKAGAARQPSPVQLVRLDLLHEEACLGEERRPARLVLLPEPPVITGLAERHRDEEASTSPEHAPELAECRVPRPGVGFGLEPVHGVVGADVLERRDEEDLVERLVRERELANVRDDGLHPLDVTRREIDPDELDSRTEKPSEIGRLCERVADLEHATLPAKAREDPRDLHDALVRGRRSLEPADPLASLSRAEPEGDGVVELPHTLGFLAAGELVDEGRPRERPVRKLRERTLTRLWIRLTPKDEPEHRVDELGVGAVVCGELGGDARVHHG